MAVQNAVNNSIRLLNYIDGWETANNATDPTNDINIGTGVCWINDRLVELTSPLTRQLDVAWGSGGGLFSGSKANSTWYHLFAILNPSTNAVNAGFDSSVSGDNIPSGWVGRRVWSVQTKSDGVIRAYTQVGDTCIWSSPPVYSNSSIGNTARTLATLTVPTGIKVEPLINLYYAGSSSNFLYLTGGDQPDETADATAGRLMAQSNGIGPVNAPTLMTNTSGQIGLREGVASSGDTARILVLGYRDSRGKR